ncbi:MAG: isoprenylcysteine carboxylmethyltransferase family protein [Bacteroidota bacterium]|nr:isoprenylcysteine carboxylmethyltransferase family protein [Bacteroidota bacterium]
MKIILNQLGSLILPINALIIIPLLIERNFTIVADMEFAGGMVLVIAGVILLIITISMFIRIGRGTLAPWSPTKNLVIGGVYSYVRNPMITGVAWALLGESLFFHSTALFTWFILFFIINSIYFILSEEPGLAKRFGEEYLEYKRNVPRWIPRLTPWKPKSE